MSDEMAAARDLLREAAAKFREYEKLHAKKGLDLSEQVAAMEPEDVLLGAADDHRKRIADTIQKAGVNNEIATRIEAFLGK